MLDGVDGLVAMTDGGPPFGGLDLVDPRWKLWLPPEIDPPESDS
jgi:hypothetical protein